MRKNVNTKPMSGFMELLPDKQLAFNKMLSTIRGVYDLYGFRPIETPLLERAEVLLTKGGGETDKQIYRFQKGDSDIALRFDLTVPLARYVAEYQNDLVFPFKIGNVGKVYRGEKPQAGRFREFYQCDMDVIGRDSLDFSYDAEVVAMVYTIFKRFGFDDFKIRFNNRRVLNGFFESLGLSDQVKEILRILDKLDRYGEETVSTEFKELGLSDEVIDKIYEFVSIKDNVTSKLSKLEIDNDMFKQGVEELTFVAERVDSLGVDKANYEIDLTIARGLDYYTGTVYETIMTDYPEFGSVCSGGRYDDLASYYTKNKFPGVGLSIGLTRLFDCLDRNELIDNSETVQTKVLVTGFEEFELNAMDLSRKLREEDINTEVLMGFKKGMKYADKLNIPYVVILGEEEIAMKKFSMKNMESGDQEMLTFDELIEKLK